MSETARAPYLAVVGGINIDIGGISGAPLVPRDSNPGVIHTSLGGVGRNIAHNLRLLGCPVGMLTAYGDDANGERFALSCLELGIDIRRARIVPGGATSTYLYIAGPDGDMAMAVSDMRICEAITPDYVGEHMDWLNGAAAVIADANLPRDTLACLAEGLTAPLLCDPVSTAKAEKLRPILPRIHALKPNRLEAELLTGIPVRSPADAETAARALRDMGVREVCLSLGAEGMLGLRDGECLRLPCLPGRHVNATGCGDAAMAALAWAELRGMSLRDTLLAALAAGAITLESPDTISDQLNEASVTARMREVPL